MCVGEWGWRVLGKKLGHGLSRGRIWASVLKRKCTLRHTFCMKKLFCFLKINDQIRKIKEKYQGTVKSK